MPESNKYAHVFYAKYVNMMVFDQFINAINKRFPKIEHDHNVYIEYHWNNLIGKEGTLIIKATREKRLAFISACEIVQKLLADNEPFESREREKLENLK